MALRLVLVLCCRKEAVRVRWLTCMVWHCTDRKQAAADDRSSVRCRSTANRNDSLQVYEQRVWLIRKSDIDKSWSRGPCDCVKLRTTRALLFSYSRTQQWQCYYIDLRTSMYVPIRANYRPFYGSPYVERLERSWQRGSRLKVERGFFLCPWENVNQSYQTTTAAHAH